MDPQLYSARAELGINLMRMGQDEEAYQAARRPATTTAIQSNATATR